MRTTGATFNTESEPTPSMENLFELLKTMRTEQHDTLESNKNEQISTNRMFESKIDRLKKDLTETMENKIKLVHDGFLISTANLQNQLDNFKTKCNAHDELLRQMQETGGAGYRTEYETDVTVLISSVPFQQDENIQQKMTELIYEHLQLPREIKIIRCERTPFRNNRPGVIKVEMDSLKSRISVLRNKNKLKTIPRYSRT